MKIISIMLGCAMLLALGCDKDESKAVDAGPDGGGEGLAFPLVVAVLSDTHLYAETLGMSDQAAQGLQAETRLVAASEAILEATVENLAVSDVDLVLISGDLTSNGAAESHQIVAQLLEGLEATGIGVYVVPGNHDVNNQYAVSYETFQDAVPDITPEEFSEIYSDLGPSEAVSTDPNSLSYSVEPLPGVRFLMLDSCLYTTGYHLNGAFSDDTVAWATDQAVEALSEGSFPVAMMHHGLVEHVDSQDTYFSGFLVDDHDAVAQELAGSGIPLVFTGHYHTMDVSMLETDGATIYDAETACLSIWPFPYRIVTFHEDGKVEMTTATTNEFDFDTGGQDLDTWAQGQLDIAFESYLTDMAQTFGLSAAQTAFAMPAMKDAWKAHMLGDEEYTTEAQQAVSEITSQGGVMILVGGLITKLYNDADPADKELTIDLAN